MTSSVQRTIVVIGATGLQGGAVARRLLSQGYQVRALTRNPHSDKALVLAALGAELVRGDMNDPSSLKPLFAGAYGVFSMQTPYEDGPEAEIRQGKHVADVAKAAGVQHLVYSSAGTGERGTGVPSWESKMQIEDYMQALGLPLTIIRPMAFMEIMTEKKFFPQLSTWHVMPKLMGASRMVTWLCTEDLAVIVANVFADPGRFIGQELQLVSDLKSIDESRAIYHKVMGKKPPRFPLPAWLFERFGFVGKDLTTMWRWLRTATLDVDPETIRAIHPGALSVEEWLRKQKG